MQEVLLDTGECVVRTSLEVEGEAFNEGYRAYQGYLSSCRNPYTVGSIQHKAYQEGHKAAADFEE